jgi:hypothetical protein
MAAGTFIAESLMLNVPLERLPLEVRKITRIGPLDNVSDAQPKVWTFIEFSVPDDQAPELASALALVLDATLGWYCDFRTEHETFVVFADRVFRYPRGDPRGRAAAAAHARTVGVPEAQIDWPE